MRHEWPIRVYYEDTDAGGVVYHARYLQFADRARTELLRSHGIALSTADAAHGVLFVVRRLSVSYKKPAFLDDEIMVATRQISSTRARAILSQVVERGGEVCAEIEVELVCVSRETMRPIAFPALVATTLQRYAALETKGDARFISS